MDNHPFATWMKGRSACEQAELAKACDTSVAYLKQISCGLRRPSEALAEAIHLATKGEVAAISFFPRLQRLIFSHGEIIT
ncbi:hypothetical protein [Pseudomonas fluorescens]|uniref:Transcriptional regulator n=1 Tax=Pseudomonas fluorescens TaxID=294 RepID=A0A2T0I3R4_PSEFL|nr:hypothetical protein [Pseudomonas fluorescens]PRW89936.1 hypothetical protein C7A10_19540 [Pseudomonas fluorescens]